MKIDNELLDKLLIEAEKSPRLRQNLDMRTSSDDTSQRMLNGLIPGTVVPVHRHQTTSETVILLKGRIDEILYDDNGEEYDRYVLDVNSACRACVIPKGVWHTIDVHEPSVIFEAKDGAYTPITPDDIMEIVESV